MPSIAKKRLSRKKFRKHLSSSFQKTKTTQTSGSVFPEWDEKVEKTKFELEVIKILDCFRDGHGNYDSKLVSFQKIIQQTENFVTVSRGNECSQRIQNASKKWDSEARSSSLVRFQNKTFTTCQIFIEFFYQRVRFWIKSFTTCQILLPWRKILPWKAWFWRKKFFKEHDFEEKFIYKNQILKKICTQNITFSFNLQRNIRLFCVLRTILKSTVLKKKLSPKCMILTEIFFSKRDNFEWKSFCKKAWFWIKKFSCWQISNHQFFPVLSDFELKILQRVGF